MKTAVAEGKALEANTLTLMITEEVTQKTVSDHLLDVISGVKLAKLGKIECVARPPVYKDSLALRRHPALKKGDKGGGVLGKQSVTRQRDKGLSLKER